MPAGRRDDDGAVRFGLLAVGGWLVAAALMVGVSWSAISVVRGAVVPRTEVASGLPVPEETLPGTAPATPAPTRPTPTANPTRPSPNPSPTAATGRAVLASGPGGTATVRCVDGVPTFLNITPRQGYTVKPDDDAGRVRFDGSSGARTEITATCTGDGAEAKVENKTARGGDG